MSNEEIYIKLELKYPKDSIVLFARMYSHFHYILFKDDVLNGEIPSEHEYDSKWWNNKYNKLKEDDRIKKRIGKISQINNIT